MGPGTRAQYLVARTNSKTKKKEIAHSPNVPAWQVARLLRNRIRVHIDKTKYNLGSSNELRFLFGFLTRLLGNLVHILQMVVE